MLENWRAGLQYRHRFGHRFGLSKRPEVDTPVRTSENWHTTPQHRNWNIRVRACGRWVFGFAGGLLYGREGDQNVKCSSAPISGRQDGGGAKSRQPFFDDTTTSNSLPSRMITVQHSSSSRRSPDRSSSWQVHQPYFIETDIARSFFACASRARPRRFVGFLPGLATREGRQIVEFHP